MSDTPASLLERLRDPNADKAWGRFVELYSLLLLYGARRVGRREPDASDLVQEVFVVLLQKLPVSDLSLLQGMPLTELSCDFDPQARLRDPAFHQDIGDDLRQTGGGVLERCGRPRKDEITRRVEAEVQDQGDGGVIEPKP